MAQVVTGWRGQEEETGKPARIKSIKRRRRDPRAWQEGERVGMRGSSSRPWQRQRGEHGLCGRGERELMSKTSLRDMGKRSGQGV